MTKLLSWYNLGTLILFLGLLWMFLPHATHVELLGEQDETAHIFHIIEGAAVVVAALGLLVLEQRRLRSTH
jgi:nitrate reductase gamma subunit